MHKMKQKFPILATRMNDQPLVYLDNAATTQKPQSVIDALSNFYSNANANIHRGVYTLSEDATTLYEAVRQQVAQFIGAEAQEIVFTKGTTEGINFIASTWGRENVHEGDEVVISALEHHSNLLPWQQLCHEKKAVLKIIPLTLQGLLDMDEASRLITAKTKLVAVTHISNAIGTEVDVKGLASLAHNAGAKILVDAAQSVLHQKVDVKELACDFLAFSGHKMYGPTGIGVLYIKKELEGSIPPYQLGGGMVYEAGYQQATWLKAPQKFEAGTPPIAQAIGLGKAITFLSDIGFDTISALESSLCRQLIGGLVKLPSVTVLGPIQELKNKGHMASFTVEGVHAHDVAAFMSSYGICVRAGHYCAQPLARELGIDAAVRVSFACYNTPEEVELLLDVLRKIAK
jgi:cysteine desulfurase/selenocysteine lyase